jgi:hypothetical protein
MSRTETLACAMIASRSRHGGKAMNSDKVWEWVRIAAIAIAAFVASAPLHPVWAIALR